jgi:hypothetical protein
VTQQRLAAAQEPDKWLLQRFRNAPPIRPLSVTSKSKLTVMSASAAAVLPVWDGRRPQPEVAADLRTLVGFVEHIRVCMRLSARNGIGPPVQPTCPRKQHRRRTDYARSARVRPRLARVEAAVAADRAERRA